MRCERRLMAGRTMISPAGFVGSMGAARLPRVASDFKTGPESWETGGRALRVHKFTDRHGAAAHILPRHRLDLRDHVMTWDSDVAWVLIYTILVTLLLLAWAYIPA
jgi:hypothetical protein